ncbi:MAG: hypothetical protein ACI8PQ_002851 [Planctomycetota bacterium]|jgi:hypothetical protein
MMKLLISVLVLLIAVAPGQGSLESEIQTGPSGVQAGPSQGGELQDEQARAQLVAAMAQAGIRLDLEAQIVSIPATVQVRQELLEYVLCTPRGQGHESLFLTEVSPTILNAALLALGMKPGENVKLAQANLALRDDQVNERGGPEPGELSADVAAAAPNISLPKGDLLYLYAAWREGEELYFYRVDDLVANLSTGRTLRRHGWVFLGSRMVQPRTRRGGEEQPEVFAAEYEGNLINVSFFFSGNTLLTPAAAECIEQTVWIGNEWLLPASSSPIEFFFSRKRLDTVPDAWRDTLPEVKRAESPEASFR